MTIEDLKETAGLAHLNLDEKELAAAFPAFEQMLDFFAAMQAAAGDRAAFPSALPDHSQAAAGSAHFRPDAAHDYHSPNPDTWELLNNAGEQDGRFIVVPNVL